MKVCFQADAFNQTPEATAPIPALTNQVAVQEV